MNGFPLNRIPDEVLLDVIGQLGSVGDVARFGAASRQTHAIVEQDGWKNFVKRRFSSLNIPSNTGTVWSQMAERLTYLDRSWERRGFMMTTFSVLSHRRYRRDGQSVDCTPVLNSRLLSSLQDELVVYGGGRDVLARRTPVGGHSASFWRVLGGEKRGYASGPGDVTAVSITERGTAPEVVVGRANGDIHIVSAEEENFGDWVQTLVPSSAAQTTQQNGYQNKSPGQVAITWTEWQAEANILAACQSSTIRIYDLARTGEPILVPSTHYDLSKDSRPDELSLVRSAKFMSKDVVACALGGSRQPLRWAKLTPTGLEFFNAAPNSKVGVAVRGVDDIEIGEKTTVRAIEPVGGGAAEALLLSAWDDGSYRLSDIRTPSPHDAIYRDYFQPYEAASSLLVYGAERFVAGSNTESKIRFFDFRNPKPYHWTNALACSPEAPSPQVAPYPQVANGEPGTTQQRGQKATRSRSDLWRPDATLYIGDPMYERVSSLAKASDVSSTFYCGLRGTVLEMTVMETDDITAEMRRRRKAPPNWQKADAPHGKVSLIETGVGLCEPESWSGGGSGMPGIKLYDLGRTYPAKTMVRRLDSAYKSHEVLYF